MRHALLAVVTVVPLTLPMIASASSLVRPALTRAAVTVTITGDDPEGEVRSPRRACKAGVVVRLVRQVGARGGGDDVPTGLSDTTDGQGSRWTYSFGNPGLSDGRYYVAVRRTPRCRAATSPTITVDRA